MRIYYWRQTRRAAIFLTLLMWLALALVPVALAQGDGYDETFDKDAPDWKLDPGWSVGDGYLVGRDQGAALYTGKDGWHDAHYKALINEFFGQADFTFMNTGHAWYQVYLMTGDGTVEVQLYYTGLGVEFPPKLGDATIKYTSDDIKTRGITLEVDAAGRAVDVSLNGQSVIHYESPQDEAPGTIGFDIYGNSGIAVDEVSVTPAGLSTPTAASPGSDLAVTGLKLRGVRKGSVIADLTVVIANQGSANSQPTTLVVYDENAPDIRVEVDVDALGIDGSRNVDVSLEGPDDWANTARDFVAQIDPNNSLGETDSENNRFTATGIVLTIGGASQPQPTPIPSSPNNPSTNPAAGPSVDPLPIILGGLGLLAVAVAGGTGLVLRNQTTVRDHRKLQKEAQQGKPPDHCTPPGRYVEAETELDLKLMKVTEISIDLIDPRNHSTRRTEKIKEKLTGELNAAIRGHWLREPENRLAERMAGVAKGLSRAIEQTAYREKEALDVRIMAHLEGIELTTTFTLYNCKKQGADGVWKKVASWEVKKQQQRDDTLFGLEELDTQATSMAMRLEVLIGPLLAEYMKRY